MRYDDAVLDVVRGEEGLDGLAVVTAVGSGHTDPIWTVPQGIELVGDPGERQLIFAAPPVPAGRTPRLRRGSSGMRRGTGSTAALLLCWAVLPSCSSGSDVALEPVCDAAGDALAATDSALRAQTDRTWGAALDEVGRVVSLAEASGSQDLAEHSRQWREVARAAAQLDDPAHQRRLLIEQSASMEIVVTCELAGFPIFGPLEPVEDDGTRPLAWLVVLAAGIGAIAAGRQHGRTAAAVSSALTGLVVGSIVFHVAASVVGGVWLRSTFTDVLAVEVGVFSAIQIQLLDGGLAFGSLILGGGPGTILGGVIAHRRWRHAGDGGDGSGREVDRGR